VGVHVLYEVFPQTRYTKGDAVTDVELQVDEPGFEAVFLETRHHYRLDNFLRVYEAQHVLKIDGILLGKVLTMKKEECYWVRHFGSKDFGFDTRPTYEQLVARLFPD